MSDPQPLPQEIIDVLTEVGIDDPDPQDEFHVKLVQALQRTKGMPVGQRLVALQWVFGWDWGRQGDALADAESEYPKVLAVKKIELGELAVLAREKHMMLRNAEIVKARDAGERSGEIAAMRADLVPEVRVAARKAAKAALVAKDVESDPEVAGALHTLNHAKQLSRLAGNRVWTIKGQIDVWKSTNANERAADRFHADGYTGGA